MVAFIESLMGIVGSQQPAHADGSAGGFGNFAVRRHEVGVRVGFDNADNLRIVRPGKVVIRLRGRGPGR